MDAADRRPLNATFVVDEPSPEVRSALADLTSDEVATAQRLLNRGEAAQDPRVAHLVVTLAQQRRKTQGFTQFTWLCSGAIGLWAAVTVLSGHRDTGTWALVVLAAAALLSTIVEVRHYRRLPLAERANREVAAAYDARSASGSPPRATVGLLGALRATLPAYALSGAFFGLLDTAVSGKPLTLHRVVLVSALWAVAMTLLSLGRAWRRAQSPPATDR
jgi:hypothetical protein